MQRYYHNRVTMVGADGLAQAIGTHHGDWTQVGSLFGAQISTTTV